jgi:hypothetical protein
MKGRLGDKVRLQHILDAANEVEIYLENVSYEQFLKFIKLCPAKNSSFGYCSSFSWYCWFLTGKRHIIVL